MWSGPLIFNATKMKILKYFNERQFWLEDDETEFHVRAFYEYHWITGYFPVGHTIVHRNRGDRRPNQLLKYFHEIENMKNKVLQSLKIHSNSTYRDIFCDNFPHNNHVREVSDILMKNALNKCAERIRKRSNFCSLHC